MSSGEIQAAQLQQIFSEIQQQRMQDIPILNPALQVESLGFREWNGQSVGILITPWFMNLIILPAAPVPELRTGDSVSFAFPSANYEFLKNTEAELTYYSCSLFSPMFEFETQEQARAVAVSVLELLFQAPQVATPAVAAPTTLSRRDLLRGKLRQE